MSFEKRNFRRKDDCADEQKKDSLKNRQETADDAQNNKNPSQDMPANLFEVFFLH